MSIASSFAGGVDAEGNVAGNVRPGETATTRTATVRVPASTSNLGSGFDCVGLAIDRWLVASASVSEATDEASDRLNDFGNIPLVSIERSGTLHNLPIEPVDDLLYAGFRRTCEFSGVNATQSEISFAVTSTIPVGRGLGSSAAAIVAGAMLANESLSLGLSFAELLVLAADVEGHPDNVAAALRGGATLTIHAGAGYKVTPLTVAPGLAFIIVVPDFQCDTHASRLGLPDTVPFGDAVLALSRSAALVKGLETGDAALLAVALEDVLHVPYRSISVPGFDDVTTAALQAGAFGATLSGSGSSLLAIAPGDLATRTADAMVAAWKHHGVRAATIVSYEPAGASAIIPQENR